MSDHLDRAAGVLWEATCPDGLRAAMRPDCWAMAQALDEAGLLVTPERDAAVAALPLPGDGCSCTPHEQSAGGVYTEYLLEYDPACPEHSEHLWDPKQGVWVLRPERDAAANGFTWEHATRHRPVRVPCDCDNPTHAGLAGDDSPPTHASLEAVPSRRLVGPWEPIEEDA